MCSSAVDVVSVRRLFFVETRRNLLSVSEKMHKVGPVSPDGLLNQMGEYEMESERAGFDVAGIGCNGLRDGLSRE